MKDPWIVARAYSCSAALLLASASAFAIAGGRHRERARFSSREANLVSTLTPLEEHRE